jgi:hypothetical protein
MKIKEKRGYNKLKEKIETIETKICEINDSLSDLKKTFSKEEPPDILDEEEMEPEICLDEIEADKAAYEAIRDICLESMLDSEPIGEA